MKLKNTLKKRKPDEREIQLFNKTGNLTAAATLLASVAVYYFSGLIMNGLTLGKNWLF